MSFDVTTLALAKSYADQHGGSSKQGDWNQNDSTQPDYIKNRPFYTGDPVETVLVEESTVSFVDNNGLYIAEFPSTFAATAGETYKVYWDGTVYECTCVNFQNNLAIGNLSIAGAGSDTGEPFFMYVDNGRGIMIGTADTSASHTVSISGVVQEVVKIDPKYIRDMYYTGDPVETVFVEESTVSFAERNGLYGAEFPSTFAATAGETYKVYWDGTTYECTCVKFNKKPAIGNLSIVGAGPDTGEPFLMVVTNGQGITIGTADTSASHTVSISGFTQEVVKIDKKYLPDTVEPYTGDTQMAPLYKNGGFSAWRKVVQEISYNKTEGYFFVNTFDTIALKGEDMPDGVFCVQVQVESQRATAFLLRLRTVSRLWFVRGFAVITNGEVLYVSSNSIPQGEAKGLFLTFRAPDSMLLKSSTANSTKQFRITVDDSGVPTITDKSDSTNTWKPTNLPTVTSSDSGKFLRVSDTGEWVAETILSASGVSF